MEKECNHIGHEGKDDNGSPYCMWCDATLLDKGTDELPCCGSTTGVHFVGCDSDFRDRCHRETEKNSD
jgi:hypothetical protein